MPKSFPRKGVAYFFFALAVAIYFYVRMDILIWQRIFETNKLWEIGINTYHWGWRQALYGFMFLGALIFYPHIRRMISFPLSLIILANSGLEDILYYLLDGRAVPASLPWLDQNPLILQPVTTTNLIISAGCWLFVVIMLEFAGLYFDRWIHRQGGLKNLLAALLSDRLLDKNGSRPTRDGEGAL